MPGQRTDLVLLPIYHCYSFLELLRNMTNGSDKKKDVQCVTTTPNHLNLNDQLVNRSP